MKKVLIPVETDVTTSSGCRGYAICGSCKDGKLTP
ncbi:hypothetical protein Kole_0762 [Kosmotoga olearia TBF 19.5.1]|uniref:Uncharacterized protein n=1 Tax=Kosmotoga olearia (strain ATCC BAA-1733 / DSM 21960 / TBF 19.5.1) TaxID=521045 RepID=C5CG33_KOSOT|nr:hypothetical protein Kole_0762 [Kosmotoga olearia TBF 19.5.1]